MPNVIPASEFATDTMGLVLRLEQRRLGEAGKRLFAKVEAGDGKLYIPALVFAEILYLSEKSRIETTLTEVFQYLQSHPACVEMPLDSKVLKVAAEINDIRELHDRLIAASARFLQIPLVTNDPVIQASTFVDTVW